MNNTRFLYEYRFAVIFSDKEKGELMRGIWNYPMILFGVFLFLIGTASAQEGADKEYIQLIVAQPSNFTYGVAEDILWSVPVIEAVLSYKMEQIDRIQVESMRDLAKEVNSYRDFT
ncbi:MAG: hypothetical protein ACOCSE_06490, partial [Chitinivibrionales bacterium]